MTQFLRKAIQLDDAQLAALEKGEVVTIDKTARLVVVTEDGRTVSFDQDHQPEAGHVLGQLDRGEAGHGDKLFKDFPPCSGKK